MANIYKTNSTSAQVKKYFWRIFYGMLGLFMVLFSGRLIYVFFALAADFDQQTGVSFNIQLKNYAGFRKSKKEKLEYSDKGFSDNSSKIPGGAKDLDNLPANQQTQTGNNNDLQANNEPNVGENSSTPKYEQKYERIAEMSNTSKNFNADEKKLYQVIQKYNGLIQYESKEGLPGSRHINLGIGVDPIKFDVTVAEIQKIGKLNSLKINKVDKTTEFKELNARKISLLKNRSALAELKNRPGNLGDMIILEEKILDIEKKIQEMGVQLGSYDSENEYCTILFSMYEGAEPSKISLLHRIKVALYWTIEVYAATIALLIFSLFLGIIGMVVTFESIKYWNKNTADPINQDPIPTPNNPQKDKETEPQTDKKI